MAEENTPEQPALNVTIEDAGPACKSLTIEIPAERIAEKIETTYTKLMDDTVLPGFRRGRAPRRLIEKRFASGVSDDAKAQLLSECYTQAIEDNKLDVLGEPEVKDHDKIEIPESGPLTFTVEVEVTPEFELPSFDGINIEKPALSVSDDDVDSEINKYQERFGELQDVEDKIVEKDYVLADVTIYAGENAGDDAEVLSENPDTYILVHGEEHDYKGHAAGIVIAELGKKLAGKSVGDSESISMTGPTSHENEKIKEQPITIKIAITKVQRVTPAEVDALPPMLGVESVEDLKSTIKESLEARSEQESQAAAHKQLSEALLEKTEFELPKGITGRQTSRLLQRQASELAQQGVPEEEIEGKIAETRESSEEDAARQLTLFFILDKAASELEIEVSEQEINGRIAMIAQQYGRRPDKLRQQMYRSGQLESLYVSIREQKTLDKILESANVTEVEGGDDEKPAKAAKKKSTKKKSTKKKSSKKKTEAKKDDDA